MKPELSEMCLLAFAVGCALLAFSQRDTSPAQLPVVAQIGATVSITATIYFTHDPGTVYVLFLLWIGIESCYLFSLRQAALQVLVIGLAYASVLYVLDPSRPRVGWWLMVLGTILMQGTMMRALRTRTENLVQRLAEACRRDPLTGLLNRRGFGETLDVEFERARRSGRPFSLIVGDLDYFKQVNDSFGHAVGDDVLVRVAALLHGESRAIDTPARLGGEELAVILPETDEHGAHLIAERARLTLRETFAQTPTPITISFGVAAFPQAGCTPDRLLQAADEALYMAKALGRDRTAIHTAQATDAISARLGLDARHAANLATVLSLAEALDIRDAGTAAHSETVGRYAQLIARRLGLDPESVERIRLAGVLHDIGKIGVSDHILHKPGPLSDEEWAEMRKHPEIGARILANKELDDICDWVLSHHERPDGCGYPRGLHGEDIPLAARIIAVADAYEAMTARRPYRSALSPEGARSELERGAGSQFAPDVVEALLAGLDHEREPALVGTAPTPT